jgi:hypothetical protein
MNDRPAPGHPGPTAIVVDVVLPVGLSYATRAAGASVYVALLVGALLPAARTAVGLLARRTVDGLGAFLVSTMLVGLVVSLGSGSPRFLLAREAWVTGFSGLWFLASALSGRPLSFTFARALLEGRRRFTSEPWESLDVRFLGTWRR